jgi:methionyl-tRNA synthetase
MVGPTSAPDGASAGKPAPPAPAVPASPPPPAGITIDEFKKVELRIGKVLEAAEHTNANKLLVLKVDLGNGEVRQVVSGIKQWYAPADLVGKTVIIVANLQPAVIRGVESRGMLLAATSGPDVIVCTTVKEAAPGSKVS